MTEDEIAPILHAYIDKLSNFVRKSNGMINRKSAIIREEEMYGLLAEADTAKKSECDDYLAQAFDQYAELINEMRQLKIQTEAEIEWPDGDIVPAFEEHVVHILPDFVNQANLQPLVEYANALMTDELVDDIPRETKIQVATAATMALYRSLTDKLDPESTLYLSNLNPRSRDGR